jgi:MRG-binding protein
MIPGINKHFQMALIIEKVTAALNRQVNSENIWKHLESMYDLGALVFSTLTQIIEK